MTHLRLILRLLTEARGPLANRLAAIASDASHFVGWLFTATGAHDSAGPMYDQALRLGLQAGDKVVAVALGYPDYDKDADVIDARKRGRDLTSLMSEWQTAEDAGLLHPDEAAVLYLQQRLFCHEVRRRLRMPRLH